jgi:hypothetical protein
MENNPLLQGILKSAKADLERYQEYLDDLRAGVEKPGVADALGNLHDATPQVIANVEGIVANLEALLVRHPDFKG